MSEDKLIINGQEVKSFDENLNLEFSVGSPIIEYPLHIQVIKGSETDKLLEKFYKNKDKYKLMISIVKVE